MDVTWKIKNASHTSSVKITADINVTSSAYMRMLIETLRRAEKWLREQETTK